MSRRVEELARADELFWLDRWILDFAEDPSPFLMVLGLITAPLLLLAIWASWTLLRQDNSSSDGPRHAGTRSTRQQREGGPTRHRRRAKAD
mmetsp:Transcript_27599/g.88757  ORF Transcript_27599/g.88757 Transcript_27599/m.88757 type:complete len:91 (-) Transcript_27599:433-705(-)